MDRLAIYLLNYFYVWQVRHYVYTSDGQFTTDAIRINFRVNRYINSGGHGTVYEIVYTDTSQSRAILKCANSEKFQSAIEREIRALRELTRTASRNDVTTIIDTCTNFSINPNNTSAYSGRALIRSQYKHVVESIQTSYNRICDIIYRLHESGWIHGDIKAHNFFQHNEHIVLGDFSSAQTIINFDFDLIECSYLEHADIVAQRQCIQSFPQVIDLYGLALMVYSHFCPMTILKVDWGRDNQTRLPYRDEVETWEPDCKNISDETKKLLKNLFMQCAVVRPTT